MKELNYSIDYTLQFLDEYKKLEKIKNEDINRYNLFKNQYETEMELYRTTRNNLSHNLIDEGYPFLVSEGMLISIQNLIFKMTVNCYDLSTKREQFVTISLDKTLKECIDTMSQYNYTYLPVLNGNHMIEYCVSQKNIISIISTNGYHPDSQLKSYTKYFRLEDNPDETYFFVKKDKFAIEAKEMFEKSQNRKKCNIIFLTESGDRKDPVLGLMTHWDVFSLEANQ